MSDFFIDIDYHKGFTFKEKEKIEDYIYDLVQSNGIDLHYGLNLAVDVSKAIHRTADVDVWFSF